MIAFTVLLFSVCFVGLVLGSYFDFRTREVPDLLNFGLLAAGFGIALLASIVFWDSSYFVASLLGFLFCFLFACLMFYTGQWGGGDAKMLMALGALIGLPFSQILSFASLFSLNFSSFSFASVLEQLPFLLSFLFLVFFIGGIYGLVWLKVLILLHWQHFKEQFFLQLGNPKNKYVRNIMLVVVGILLLSSFFLSDLLYQLLFFVMGIFLFFLYYSSLVIRAVEQVAFVKELPVAKVTEGDWVAADVVVERRTIIRKKDLGISPEQLQELRALAKKGKIKTVKVKYGIPFVPSFLLAFVVAVLVYYVL